MASRTGLVAVCVMLLSGLVGCNDDVASVESTKPEVDGITPGNPRIHISEPRRSLGKVPLGPQTISVAITNRGDGDLKLIGVESSCRCAKVELEVETISPGATATLDIGISPRVPEESSARIVLLSNDPAQPRTVLFLEWTAVGSFSLEPSVLDFGIIRPGEKASREIRLMYDLSGAGGPICTVAKLVCQPPQVLKTRKLGVEEMGESLVEYYDVELQPTSESDGSAKQGVVRFHFEGCPQLEAYIPVGWKVREVLEASPSRLFLGAGPPGRDVRATAELSCDDGQELAIAGCEWSRGLFDLEVTRATTNTSTIQLVISGRGPTQPGFLQDELIIRCTQPLAREFRLPVSGLVLAK